MRAFAVVALLLSSGAFAAPVYVPPSASAKPSPTAPTISNPKEAATTRARLLVMDLRGNDVDAATTKTIQGVVTTALARYDAIDVISGDDIKQLVQFEAEKASMGCDEAGCLAEIADALGAKLVVFGTVGTLGDAFVLNLNLFDAEKATGLGRVVVQSESMARLPKKLRPKLHELLSRFYKDHGLALPPLPIENDEAAPPDMMPWIVAGAGGAAVLVGGALASVGIVPLLQYNDAKARILAAEETFARDAGSLAAAKAAQQELAEARQAWSSVGYVAADVGVAVAVVGAVAGVVGVVWAMTSGAPGDESAASTTPAQSPAGGAR